MDNHYTWPADWDLTGFTTILDPLFFANALSNSDPGFLPLLKDLGPTFLRSLTAALLASNGHFPALLLSTLWGLRSGHTTLCVQGIFGSGKTYSASLLLIIAASVLELNCILTAEPNLPLATATEAISFMLTDASDNITGQYRRVLASKYELPIALTAPPMIGLNSFARTPLCVVSFLLRAPS